MQTPKVTINKTLDIFEKSPGAAYLHKVGDVAHYSGAKYVQTAEGLTNYPAGATALIEHAQGHRWGFTVTVKVGTDGNPYVRILVGRERGTLLNGKVTPAVQVHVLWRWNGAKWDLQQPYIKRDAAHQGNVTPYERKQGKVPAIVPALAWSSISLIGARELIRNQSVVRTAVTAPEFRSAS